MVTKRASPRRRSCWMSFSSALFRPGLGPLFGSDRIDWWWGCKPRCEPRPFTAHRAEVTYDSRGRTSLRFDNKVEAAAPLSVRRCALQYVLQRDAALFISRSTSHVPIARRSNRPEDLHVRRWRSLYGQNEHGIFMVSLQMMHTTLQICTLECAHAHRHDRILSTICMI